MLLYLSMPVVWRWCYSVFLLHDNVLEVEEKSAQHPSRWARATALAEIATCFFTRVSCCLSNLKRAKMQFFSLLLKPSSYRLTSGTAKLFRFLASEIALQKPRCAKQPGTLFINRKVTARTTDLHELFACAAQNADSVASKLISWCKMIQNISWTLIG